MRVHLNALRIQSEGVRDPLADRVKWADCDAAFKRQLKTGLIVNIVQKDNNALFALCNVHGMIDTRRFRPPSPSLSPLSHPLSPPPHPPPPNVSLEVLSRHLNVTSALA